MDPDLLDLISNPNSPVKPFREPDAEISPVKPPIKKKRLNLDHFSHFSGKKVNFNYGRIQSHSASRHHEPEDESQIKKNIWQEEHENHGIRSVSREVTGKYLIKESNDREIEHLNSKIKNLIKENSDLKFLFEYKEKAVPFKKTSNRGKRGDNDVPFMDITFKPQEVLDSVKQHKRFPREVFRIPKGRYQEKNNS